MIRGRYFGAFVPEGEVFNGLRCESLPGETYKSANGRTLFPLNPWFDLSNGKMAQPHRTMFQWNGTAQIIEVGGSPPTGNMQSSMQQIASSLGSFPLDNIMSYPMWSFFTFGKVTPELQPYITKANSSLKVADIHNATVEWAQNERLKLTKKLGATLAEAKISQYKTSLVESARGGISPLEAERTAIQAGNLAGTLVADKVYAETLEEAQGEGNGEGSQDAEVSVLPRVALAAGMAVIGFGVFRLLDSKRRS